MEALELLAQGKRNLLCGEVPKAVNELQEVCRKLADKFGETADECAEAYFYYGKALLELSRMESGVLGNALQGIEDEADDKSDEKSSADETGEKDETTVEEKEKISEQIIDAMLETDEEVKARLGTDKIEAEKVNGKTEKKDIDKENGEKEVKENGKEPDEEVTMETDEKQDVSEKETATKTEGQKDNKDKGVKDDEMEVTGDKKEVTGDKKEVTGDKKEVTGDKMEVTDDKKEVTGEKKVTGDKKEVTGDKKEVTGDKKEVTGEKKVTGDKKEVTGDKKTDEDEDMSSDDKKEGETSQEEGGESEDIGDEESEEQEGTEEGTEDGETEDGSTEEGKKDGEGSSEKKEEEDVSNLQLAWEMLELSKIIFKRNNSKESKLKLADSFLKLGEVCMETEQYETAISDFKECLRLQTELLNTNDRAIAETHYQLGLACTFHGLYDDAVDYYKKASSTIESLIADLKKTVDEMEGKGKGKEKANPDDPLVKAQKEIKELEEIIPEILAKIEDVLDEKRNADQVKQMVKENLTPSLEQTTTNTTGFGQTELTTSQSGAVQDITHLVRKRKKVEEDSEDSSKKAKKQENGSGDKVNGTAEVNGKAPVNGQASKSEVSAS